MKCQTNDVPKLLNKVVRVISGKYIGKCGRVVGPLLNEGDPSGELLVRNGNDFSYPKIDDVELMV